MAKSNPSALSPESLKHPNAFMAQDGRTLYRYKLDGDDGEEFIFQKPIEEMEEQDYYNLPITYRDLQAGRLPQNLTVTFKDKQWAGHWFNKKAGDGARVGQARALGFVPAKKEDLESYFDGLIDTDGAVEQSDLVLFKIHKHKLYMKVAEYIAKAKHDGGIDGYREVAMSNVSRQVKRKDMDYYHSPAALTEFQGLGAAPALK